MSDQPTVVLPDEVPDRLVEAAIAAAPGLVAGYRFSPSDLRTDLRDALAGALTALHARP